jgi:NAD-dependent SIR2 family protein deacetylase
VGTSAVVYPAASLIPLARKAKAKVIEINLDETPMSFIVDAALRGKSGEILPRLLD